MRLDEDGNILHAEVIESVSESEVPTHILSELDFDRNYQLKEILRVKLTDETHIRFQLYLEQVPIVGNEIVAHLRDGRMYSFNGFLYSNVNRVSPAVSSEKAISNALEYANAETYMWELPEEEFMLKLWNEDSTATHFPEPELIYAPHLLNIENEFALCYMMEVYAKKPHFKKAIYINALSGDFWAEEELIHIIDVEGVANTKYRGQQDILTDSTGPGSYRLRESGRGGGIETYNMEQRRSYGLAVDFTDSDNYWNNVNADQDEVATDAHFGAEMTYDYFFNKFNRNSFNDNGAKIRSYVHYDSSYSNAFWNGSVMTYGDGNGTSWNPLTSLDVCGHEIAHAVTTYSARLIYAYESGALNESFSDIFGNSIEYYADSSQFNWRIGEDFTVNGNGIRNMADPKNRFDPDTYEGQYWYTGTGDNGGVHTNSGVQNFWYYLLCTGATGTNDNGDSYTVDSIGMAKAEAIAYRNLTVYLTRRSDYEEARYYAIQSAADLFGSCSPEVIACTNAWYAVGVGAPYDSFYVEADFTADSLVCFASDGVQFYNKSKNYVISKWYFGDGDSSFQKSPKHIYPGPGTYSVKLIAQSCHGNNLDTIEKLDYIEIDSTRDICNAILMPRGTWETYDACEVFIYDHSGEDDYTGLVRDTLTLNYEEADSATLTFELFRYETGWDSVYLYDSDLPGVNLIGGYTGNNLPNSGQPIKLVSGHLTLIHFSDPLVVDDGFKARLRTYRSDLRLEPIPDTLVCYKQELTLNAIASGGYREQYYYLWDGVQGDSSYTYRPETDHELVLELGDACTKRFVRDTVLVQVRAPLQIDSFGDLEFCNLETVQIVASASGGVASSYNFEWSWNSFIGDTLNAQFEKDTSLSIYLSDNCSAINDTLQFEVKVREPISLSYVPEDTVCQGADAMFMVQGEGGLDSFLFITESEDTFGWSQQYLRVISPESVGDYSYYVTVTDLCSGINDTAFLNLHVRDSLKLSLSQDTIICNGTEANLRADGRGGKSDWYEFNWPPSSFKGKEIKVQPFNSQWYYVELNDACSSFEPRDSVYIKVLDPIEVNIFGKDTSCYGELVEFRSEVSGGDSTSYIYEWKNHSSSDTNLVEQFYNNQEIVLEVWDNCSAEPALDTLYHSNRPALEIDIIADSSICMGQELQLNTILSGGVKDNYEIEWSDGLGAGESNSIIVQKDTVVMVQLSDACSEIAYDSIEVKALNLPELEIEISQNPGCTNVPIRFNSIGNNSGNADYLWTVRNETFGVKEPSLVFEQAGRYSVKLKVLNELGCVDSLELLDTVLILEYPVADFEFTPDSAPFNNATFSFINESHYASTFLWDFDGIWSSTEENPSLFLDRVGDYRVILYAENEAGCVDTVQKEIRVHDTYSLYVPNAFSPNGDQLNDVFRPIFSGMLEYELMIYNRLGQVLYQSEDMSASWDGTYRGEPVQDGHYFVFIRGFDLNGNPVEHRSIVLVLK